MIIIEDEQCKKELDALLTRYRKSLRVDTGVQNISESLGHISEVLVEHQKKEQRLLINAASSSVLVKIKDIIRCQSNRNYTELFLQNGKKITVTKPLKQFAELPLFSDFARIHLSHLVNINYIDRFIKTDGTLLLLNGTVLPVSKRRRDEWIRKLDFI
ncbi:MAG: LytTR family transcriptional regulator [Bacteroidia bacterium]|nr:LytTR family transcriptional regulator [Bacteroidia bacterium]